MAGRYLGYGDADEAILGFIDQDSHYLQSQTSKVESKEMLMLEKEALWCGRIVSGKGVRHDSARVCALA